MVGRIVQMYTDPGRKCRTLDDGHWTLDAELWTLDSGLWTLDSGLSTPDAGRYTLHTGLWDYFGTESEASF